MSENALTLHATAVAVGSRGLLIKGASGSGKSGLALEMMARGATLVADDAVVLRLGAGVIRMSAPPRLTGMIEARGIGLLSARSCSDAPLVAVLDLDHLEQDRWPEIRETALMGQKVPLLHNFASPYFPAALVQYLKGGRRE